LASPEVVRVPDQSVEVILLPEGSIPIQPGVDGTPRMSFPGLDDMTKTSAWQKGGERVHMVGLDCKRVMVVPGALKMAQDGIGRVGKFGLAEKTLTVIRIQPILNLSRERSVVGKLNVHGPRLRVQLQPCLTGGSPWDQPVLRQGVRRVEREEVGRAGLLPVGKAIPGAFGLSVRV
jgi:hypothetical protein